MIGIYKKAGGTGGSASLSSLRQQGVGMNLTRRSKRRLKRAASQGLVISSGIAAILLFMHGQISPRITGDVGEGGADMAKICFVDDSPYMKPEHYQATPEIPLMFLDKQSEAEVSITEDEVLAIYHDLPFAMPTPSEDKRNPIGKWVGKGLLNPHILHNSHSGHLRDGCNIKVRGIDEPNTLTLILLMVVLLMVIYLTTYLKRRKQ